jgi:hypothetical protein
MPYESAAQRGWAHTQAGEEALGGPEKVAEWDHASKGMDLPKRAPKKNTRDYGKDHPRFGSGGKVGF